MTTIDFITVLFSRVDDWIRTVPTHAQAHLYPGEGDAGPALCAQRLSWPSSLSACFSDVGRMPCASRDRQGGAGAILSPSAKHATLPVE